MLVADLLFIWRNLGIKSYSAPVIQLTPQIGCHKQKWQKLHGMMNWHLSAFASCLRALGEDGQYLVIGFVGGIPQLPANQVLLRNRRVIGVDWGAWAGRNPEGNAQLLEEVLAKIAAKQLSPVEPQVYLLSEAAKALADLEQRRVAGKVVLVADEAK